MLTKLGKLGHFNELEGTLYILRMDTSRKSSLPK